MKLGGQRGLLKENIHVLFVSSVTMVRSNELIYGIVQFITSTGASLHRVKINPKNAGEGYKTHSLLFTFSFFSSSLLSFFLDLSCFLHPSSISYILYYKSHSINLQFITVKLNDSIDRSSSFPSHSCLYSYLILNFESTQC